VRHSYYIAVEDPFEITCNAGRTLDYITYLKVPSLPGRLGSVFIYIYIFPYDLFDANLSAD